MQTKKNHLVVMSIVGILCVSALGKIEPPLPEKEPLRIGNHHLSLTDVDQLYVQVITTYMIPKIADLSREEIRLKIEQKLREQGINYVQPKPSPMPSLRVKIALLQIPDTQRYVFHIHTSLARMMTLKTKQKINLKVNVWQTNPVMQIAPIENIPAKVTEAALEQIDAFVQAYTATNPPGAAMSGTNPSAVSAKETETDVKPAAAEYKYIASKSSDIFHRPECRWAKNISPENLVTYKNRDEAKNAGKRPCKTCNP